MTGRPGTGDSTPRQAGRPLAKRRLTFNLEQGETEPQAAAEQPPQEVSPPAASQPPARTNDRPRRETRRPAWQLSGEFDMEASALELRCSDRVKDEADNSVGGVTGHVNDDTDMAGSHPERYNTWPLGGAVRRAAMLESVVRILNRLVDLLANESMEVDQAVVENGEDF